MKVETKKDVGFTEPNMRIYLLAVGEDLDHRVVQHMKETGMEISEVLTIALDCYLERKKNEEAKS